MISALVLDTSAVMAYLLGEPGEERVRELFGSARRAGTRHALSVVNWGEVVYSLRRHRDASTVRTAIRTVDALPIELVGADRELAFAAAALKAGRGLGYVDCFAAALAQRMRATLVTADADFKRVEDLVKVLWLR